MNEETEFLINSSKVDDPSPNDTLNPVNKQITPVYEPLTSMSSTTYSINGSSFPHGVLMKKRMFQVRRTFLLIVTFDLIFMALLWIIYNQILLKTIDTAFHDEVLKYSIRNSSFDIVGLSAIRFFFLMITYAILKFSHWIFVTLTTLGSTGFIIAKTCLFSIDRPADISANYIILIASFIIAWIEIWFFDYRVIPHERRLREASTQCERRPLLHSYGSGSISSVSNVTNHHIITIPNERHQSFYSLHSVEGSDTEETIVPEQQRLHAVHSDSNISQSILETPPTDIDDENNNDDYEKQAEEILDEIWRIYQDESSWYEETRTKDGIDVVLSKNVPKWGKIFRLISTVTGSRNDIVQMLFDRQEDLPKWSSSVNDCRILEVINNNLYITYQMTNEQAQGFIAKRDFVNITVRRYIDDIAILAAQACVYSRMSPKDNCVRAENGPTAYIIEKIDETTCKFTWILNVNLKGWIPQYIINSTLASVQLNLVESLRNYLLKITDTSSISSSTIDDSIS